MSNRTCSEDGCDKPVIARGLCGMDYKRFRDAGKPMPPTRSEAKRECAVEDCPRAVSCKGYCKRHSENLRLFGEPIPRHDRPLEARLREVGWTVSESGCWEWKGSRNGDGYGLFTATRLGYVGAGAHRVMYECSVEPIPDGLIVRHTCDNPPCVNPDHLLAGTKLDSALSMIERGRHWAQNRTHCVNGHDLRLPGATRRGSWGNGIEGNVCVECARGRSQRCRAANIEASRASVARRKMRSRISMDATDKLLSAEYRKAIAGDLCTYCGAHGEQDDHINPLARGGTDHWWNLQRTCQRCNRRKSTMTHDEFLASGRMPFATDGIALPV